MKSPSRYVVMALAVLSVASGCTSKSDHDPKLSQKQKEEHEAADDDLSRAVCILHLITIHGLLVMWAVDHEWTLPETLYEIYTGHPLYPKDPDARVLRTFVCPATRHKPGDAESIDEWSDYVYVPGQRLAKNKGDPRTLVLYDKQGNHLGGRYELYTDGTVRWRPAQLMASISSQLGVRDEQEGSERPKE